MCGRLTNKTDPSALALELGAEIPDHAWPARYNVAPTDELPTVIVLDSSRILEPLRWGLVPFWAKSASIGARMINARAETILTKPAYKESFLQRRCLVIADGFYEWRREGKQRFPRYFQVDGGAPFTLAGLWDRWRMPNGSTLRSCTIITTGANPLVAEIHERMPVILPENERDCWLESADSRELQQLLTGFPAARMSAIEVSQRVNQVGNDDPELIVPSPSNLVASEQRDRGPKAPTNLSFDFE